MNKNGQRIFNSEACSSVSQSQGTVIEPSFAQPAVGYVLEGNSCVCGLYTDETPRFRLCPLNLLNTFNENDP